MLLRRSGVRREDGARTCAGAAILPGWTSALSKPYPSLLLKLLDKQFEVLNFFRLFFDDVPQFLILDLEFSQS